MKVMLIAFLAIVVISVGANLLLRSQDFSSEDAYKGPSVRLH
ncbi:hypothetical protein [Algicella marina]|nr:hypothetical protein [Algicella marina]